MRMAEPRSDVLGDPFLARVLELAPDAEGPVVATLVQRRASAATSKAVLYVHGYNDYFFQVALAEFFVDRGYDFYAVDLRKCGRSLLGHQTPNMCTSLTDYDEELDGAAAAISDDGHDELMLVAHSTGGLTVPLWLQRRPRLPVRGLILNSPFFAFSQPLPVRLVALPLVARLGRYRPMGVIPNSDGLYGESLHRQFRGEWDYNLAWKPKVSFPVRAGWVRSIHEGQRRLHAGLDLEVPALVLCAENFLRAKRWVPELQRADAVLDPDGIARWSTSIGRNVTCTRIADGMHDVVLSPPPARHRAYQAIDRWLRAYV